jgi:cardiolipin synthase
MNRLSMQVVATVILGVMEGCAPTGPKYKIDSPYSVHDPQFIHTIGTLLGPPILAGNSVVTLQNGDEIFPAMLDAIAKAKKTITFETYIYWSGEIGKQFADALCERARAGVRVHILIDAVGGNRIDNDYIKRMKKAGAEVVIYHALKWYDIGSTKRINNRTHRKLLVLDGVAAFTGGVGIADEWAGHAQDPDHWRDTHYRVEGPVVGQLQAAFMDNWMEATGEVLHSADYFPPLPDAGPLRAQCFMSSFRGGSKNMQLMYLLSFAAARTTIRLSTSYFVPDRQTTEAFIEARRRGVTVQIIVPGPLIDEKLVREASRARWAALLKAGVEIYEYQPTMYHVKLLIVDNAWASVGSSNLDNRSFRLNDEVNLNLLDPAFAAQQARVFEDDLKQSRRTTYEMLQSRSIFEKIEESLASLLGPQL